MTERATQVTKIKQNLEIMAASRQTISVEQYLKTLGLLTPQMADRIKALQDEPSPATQPTLDWHYLPELPSEPEPLRTERYLVASDVAVHEGWYEGNGRWAAGRGGGKVRAWATWPEAPPVPVG